MLVTSRQLLEAVDYLLAACDPWQWANRDTGLHPTLTASGLAASLSAYLAAILVATLLPFCVSVVMVTMSPTRTSVSPHIWPSQMITASAVGHHMDRVIQRRNGEGSPGGHHCGAR
jgi:hypothetical protein